MLLKLVLVLGLFGLQCESCLFVKPKPDPCQHRKSCSACLTDSKCFWELNQEKCEVRHWYTLRWSSRAFDKDDCNACLTRKTCSACLTDDECFWGLNQKKCEDRHWYTLRWWWRAFDGKDCPCPKCQSWYDVEKKDTTWLVDLNKVIPCPCKARKGFLSLKPADQPEEDWKVDWACFYKSLPLCWIYHPGAFGCIRSNKTTTTGAGQQCCYDKNYNLIPAGTKAAGTPDKATEYSQHQKLDVIPFTDCCKHCETQPSHCDYYINDVRKGDYSHCGI